MGRIQLVKSIIHGMLVYSFHVYMWPLRLLRSLDSWIKNFIWSGDIHTRKVCTVSWKVLCLPGSAGGLDVKPTRLINESFMLKLAWQLVSSNLQWATLFRRRYFINGRPTLCYVKSSVWSSFRMHVGTILSNSLWVIGTGANINLWTDNWLGESLVDLLHIDPLLHDGFTATVADVIADRVWHLPGNLLPHVSTLLNAIVLPVSPLPDSFVWVHSPDGGLSSRQALSFLRPAAPSLPWATLIWRACIPPSHSFIFWRLMHGKMPMDENLRARGCVMVSVCCFCMKTDETSHHLFLSCPFAVCLWNWLGGKLNCTIDLSSVLSLLSCIPVSCSSQVTDIFVAAVVHTLHIIWISRNFLRFSTTPITVHASQVRLHASVAMSGNISTSQCLSSDAPFLDSFYIHAHHRQIRDVIPVVWKAPSSPWVKVNTDGSVVGNNAACGGLFRDHLGTCLGAFYCNLGTDTVFNSEILGYIFALEFAAQNGWYNIWIERDSTSALMVFRNSTLVPLLLRNRWHNACSSGVQVISSHIFREGNGCADKLASMGHATQGSVWMTSVPPQLRFDFFRDICGFPTYRLP